MLLDAHRKRVFNETLVEFISEGHTELERVLGHESLLVVLGALNVMSEQFFLYRTGATRVVHLILSFKALFAAIAHCFIFQSNLHIDSVILFFLINPE